MVQDPNNVRGDYGPAPMTSPISSTSAWSTLSQFGHGGLVSHLLSNWNLAPLVRYQSGLPVNPATGKDNSLTGSG